MKIVILDRATCGEGLDFSAFDRLGTTIAYDNLRDREQIIKATADCNIIVLNKVVLDSETIARLSSSVKLIAITATGYDNVDLQAASLRQIKVSNVPGYGTYAVAQLTMLFILNCSFSITQQLKNMNALGWDKEIGLQLPMSEVAGKTLGVIGLGAIGSQVAKLGLAFGMRVIAYNRSPIKQPEVSQVSLADLAKQADYIALTCALTKETSKMINHAFLVQMKPSAYLINTARGGLIDEEALIEVLQQRKIAGAALDVLTQEPPAATNPLLTMDNVMLTPHIGWAPQETRQRCIDIVESNIASFAYGEPQNILN